MFDIGDTLQFPEDLLPIANIFNLPSHPHSVRVRSIEVFPNIDYLESLNYYFSLAVAQERQTWFVSHERWIMASYERATRILPAFLFIPGSWKYQLVYEALYGSREELIIGVDCSHNWSIEGF